jgi:carbon monoxide dehydrogenase subunit G
LRWLSCSGPVPQATRRPTRLLDVEIENAFTIAAGVDEAWKVLLDVERIVPCMPGAALDSVDGDDFTGTVKVKLGPIALTYKGSASYVEKDEVTRRAVIEAKGRDTRGNGTANATITATLHQAADTTEVRVVTDLDITGKPAQLGRGMIVEVTNKLLGQFASCLADNLADGGSQNTTPVEASSMSPSTAPDSADAPASTPKATYRSPSPEPINLIESVGPAALRRLGPVLAGIVALVVLSRLRRRKRHAARS